MKETTILDEYLKLNNCTRYTVTKISGIPETTIRQQARKNDLSGLNVNTLRSIGMTVGKNSWTVLKELEDLELSKDDLLGFRELLDQYKVRFPKLEEELRDYIKELNDKEIKLNKFTFNRFNAAEHEDIKVALETALSNALDTLEELLEKIDSKNGES